MMRRAVSNALRASSVSVRTVHHSAVTARKHLPLGAVPEHVDLSAVRDKWGSNAMDLIQDAPPIVVDGPVVACNGGGGALGHPIEYIKLYVSDEDAAPQVCKYCGLRYVRKKSH